MQQPRRADQEVRARVHHPHRGGGQGVRDAAAAQPRARGALRALRTLRARIAAGAHAQAETYQVL